MSITLDIPDKLFQRLQKYAVPLVDTPISVIEKWADYFEEKTGGATAPVPIESSTETKTKKKFNPLQPPDLRFTRARGKFGADNFATWNDLVRIAHIHALAKAKSFEELRTATNAQIQKGNHSERGYHFVPEIGISIQGVDANHAWPYALRLAQYLKIPLQAVVEWRNNPRASNPGATGLLDWSP